MPCPGHFIPGNDLVRNVEMAPGPVWKGAKNLAPTGTQSLDRPAHSQLLHHLHYPSQQVSLIRQETLKECIHDL
jgi:hypothetical protein